MVIDGLRAAYEAGASVRQLATLIGRSYGSVYGALRPSGVGMRPHWRPASRCIRPDGTGSGGAISDDRRLLVDRDVLHRAAMLAWSALESNADNANARIVFDDCNEMLLFSESQRITGVQRRRYRHEALSRLRVRRVPNTLRRL